MKDTCDLFVIGGGINGAAVARDAVGRGLKVCLAERNDYGHATSSASSKLIHGGLRYLEQLHIRLVRESLRERAVMLAIAPHLVRRLRFILPVTRRQPRPAWMVRLGLLAYDWLAGPARIEPIGSLARKHWRNLDELDTSDVRALLHYPDLWVDDSRLVLSTLLDARARGASIRNRCEVLSVHPCEVGYRIDLDDNGTKRSLTARIVVNAAGPWADRFVLPEMEGGAPSQLKLKLVRGSHLVIRNPAGATPYAYTLQNHDKRVVFVLPWMDDYRIIGTTDVVHQGGADRVACTDEERDYLIAAYNRNFRQAITPQDIVWAWSGVRPLLDDGKAAASNITRDYKLDLRRHGAGGYLSIFGGKLTTHRKLAEQVMQLLAPLLPGLKAAWTSTAPLYGGALSEAALAELSWRAPKNIDPLTVRRWLRTYGSQTDVLFDTLGSRPALGRVVAGGLTEAELRYAADVEDARTAADFLGRRTKTFLSLSPREQDDIAAFFGSSPDELRVFRHD
jgi:glycerol-3-phosphate dehydrogenase